MFVQMFSSTRQDLGSTCILCSFCHDSFSFLASHLKWKRFYTFWTGCFNIMQHCLAAVALREQGANTSCQRSPPSPILFPPPRPDTDVITALCDPCVCNIPSFTSLLETVVVGFRRAPSELQPTSSNDILMTMCVFASIRKCREQRIVSRVTQLKSTMLNLHFMHGIQRVL